MGNFYAIKILDKVTGKLVGELMTATPAEIMTLIGKGFTVVDISNGEEMTMESMSTLVGVSDGVIMG